MSSVHKNLSANELNTPIPNAKAMRFGIVVSEWNQDVTLALQQGAYQTLISNGALPENIIVSYVPGSYELTLGAQLQLESNAVDAVICLGCVIQGETRHFDFICDAVAQGITNLNIKYNKPVIFGVSLQTRSNKLWIEQEVYTATKAMKQHLQPSKC